ncbi:OmpP1/FadL family transporter [Flavobacterium ardleyense]|uniref:OmpP1/FadL family transporter n=1 Tax=Flavobacterium ardleyense TaxID=2038737 RepID=A0ABW5Z6P6_9FLAO
MRKIIVSLLLGSAMLSTAQETTINDALRYATNNLTGTARFRGMSGAFGAVGGDMSAINVNPAGSAFFNNNYASISGSSFNSKNNSNYFGNVTNDKFSTLDLNQIGAVLVFNDKSGKSDWSKIVVGLNYENTNDFDNRFFNAGVNPNNSIDRYFLDKAQGLPLEYVVTEQGESITELYTYLGQTSGLGFPAQQAMLAFQGYLIDTDAPESYFSNVETSGNYYQDNYVTTTGYNGKLSFNFATSYQNKLFLGINLNAHFTDYLKSSSVYESNNNRLNDTGFTATDIQFDNELYTYGTGFSLNLGAIYKFTESFRGGIAYESPTWYRLNDELAQRLIVVRTDGVSDFREVIAPNTTNLYDTYKIQTPSKWTVSAAYIFDKIGLLSIDYAMKDYSNTKFKPTSDDTYRNLNTDMDNLFQNAYELRIGGEYKIKQWSVRGGYRFEESPYKNDFAMGDLTGYSTGIGYNFGESKLDLAYANDHRNYNMALISSGMNDTARIRTTNNNVTLTYSINF